MKNWLEGRDDHQQRQTPCSQPGFPMMYCTCTVCSTIQREQQRMVLIAEKPSQELIGLYNRVFVPVG